MVDPRLAAILRTERGPTMTCSPRLTAQVSTRVMSGERLIGAHLPATYPERRETTAGECSGYRAGRVRWTDTPCW